MEYLIKPTQEELFLLWCYDAIEAGYIKEIRIPKKGFEVYPAIKVSYIIEKLLYKGTKREETKRTIKYKTLLQAVTYKPDAIIVWTNKAMHVLFTPYGLATMEGLPLKDTYFYASQDRNTKEWISPAEIKSPPGSGGKNTSDASFRILQKVLWHKFHIFVNKVYNYPNSVIKDKKTKRFKRFKNPEPYLWMSTFTPTRFFMTDKLTKRRTISNWKAITIKEFEHEKIS